MIQEQPSAVAFRSTQTTTRLAPGSGHGNLELKRMSARRRTNQTQHAQTMARHTVASRQRAEVSISTGFGNCTKALSESGPACGNIGSHSSQSQGRLGLEITASVSVLKEASNDGNGLREGQAGITVWLSFAAMASRASNRAGAHANFGANVGLRT